MPLRRPAFWRRISDVGLRSRDAGTYPRIDRASPSILPVNQAEGFAMSADYQLARSVSDIQSKIASLEHLILRSAGTSAQQPGRGLVLAVAAAVSRSVGNDTRADWFEKAATAPAMTTVPTWA